MNRIIAPPSERPDNAKIEQRYSTRHRRLGAQELWEVGERWHLAWVRYNGRNIVTLYISGSDVPNDHSGAVLGFFSDLLSSLEDLRNSEH